MSRIETQDLGIAPGTPERTPTSKTVQTLAALTAAAAMAIPGNVKAKGENELPWSSPDPHAKVETNGEPNPSSATVTLREGDDTLFYSYAERGECPDSEEDLMQVDHPEIDEDQVESTCEEVDGEGNEGVVQYIVGINGINEPLSDVVYTIEGDKVFRYTEVNLETPKATKAEVEAVGTRADKVQEDFDSFDFSSNRNHTLYAAALASLNRADTFDTNAGWMAVFGGYDKNDANWMAGAEYQGRFTYIPTVPVNGQSTNVTVINNGVLLKGGVDLPLGAGFHLTPTLGVGASAATWPRTIITPNVVANAGTRWTAVGNADFSLELELGTPSIMLGVQLDGTVLQEPRFAGATNANSFPGAQPVNRQTKTAGNIAAGAQIRGIF